MSFYSQVQQLITKIDPVSLKLPNFIKYNLIMLQLLLCYLIFAVNCLNNEQYGQAKVKKFR